VGVLDDLDSLLAVDCPRCGRGVEQQFYGPCERCLAELRSAYQAETTEVGEVIYEPKMNVTPNAVALKDD
jgi:hypothetical protein